jgi:hypothetical protein
MIPKQQKMYQMNTKCTKISIKYLDKIFQVAIKYINIIQPKALQNLSKFVFLVWKQTIWQPCFPWGARLHYREKAATRRIYLGSTRKSKPTS